MGVARPSKNGLKLSKLVTVGEDNRAILSKIISFKAQDYPFVEYKINNRHPGLIVHLIWRTAGNPDQIHNTRLHWRGDKTTVINMAKLDRWQGNITELGLDIYGDLRDKPLTVEGLTLTPYSSGAAFFTAWSEWAAFHGWDQTSINYLPGTPKNPIISPAVSAAAWVSLALLFLAVTHFFIKTHNIVTYGATILIPWISLDMLWQEELNAQLTETKYLFAGKTLHEKYLAGSDREFYLYAKHLKEDVLPEPGVRIFLLHNSAGHNYERLRTQFHLLPHNIYNYGHIPQPHHTNAGDYILVLETIPKLKYNHDSKRLTWDHDGKQQSLKANLIDTGRVGSLYKVPEIEDGQAHE